MRYPYHRLLRFLISRKVDVNDALERYGLPEAGGIWLASTKTQIKNTAPHALAQYLRSDDTELPTRDGILEWAHKEGILPLWEMQGEFGGGPPRPELDLAFRVFVNPYSRAMLGMLLLTQVSEESISRVFEKQFDISLTGEMLEIYRVIFWDVEHMGRQAWEHFVPLLMTKEERHYIAIGLSNPGLNDVEDMMGMKSTVDHMDIVDHIASSAYMKYKEALDHPQPELMGAMKWADLALKAIGTKKQISPKTTESEDALPADGFRGLFSVQVSKSSHPTLAELQGHKPESTNAKPQEGE